MSYQWKLPQGVTLIGISGKIGSGKSESERILTENGFISQTFASPIRDATARLYNCPEMRYRTDQEFKNQTMPGNTMSNGQLLVHVGTALRAALGEDVFIHALGPKIRALTEKGHRRIVVADMRFKNEYDYITSVGGYVVRLSGDPNGDRARSTRDPTDPSEVELDEATFDIKIHNMGSKDTLAWVWSEILRDLELYRDVEKRRLGITYGAARIAVNTADEPTETPE